MFRFEEQPDYDDDYDDFDSELILHRASIYFLDGDELHIEDVIDSELDYYGLIELGTSAGETHVIATHAIKRMSFVEIDPDTNQ